MSTLLEAEAQGFKVSYRPMTLTHRLVVLAVVLISTFSSASEPANARLRQVIEARNATFSAAIANQDLATAASLYDVNVIFQAPGAPTIRGRAGVVNFLIQQVTAGAVEVSLTTESVRTFIALDNGSLEVEEIGTNIITYVVQGQRIAVPGKYMVIWRFPRGLSSEPVIVRDSFSFSVPFP
ncbi:MAG: nuclear transport factor 2 family protein [Archangium sp.]|nr:nuclear transport factor 2 family protein [Archangium sp.]MDP3570927.1 nuclear transport factor 2 family protein [Archangium sp.]